MTEPTRQPVKRIGLSETVATVALFSALIAIVIAIALSVQMSRGGDPALASKAPQVQPVKRSYAPPPVTSAPPAPDPAPVVTRTS